MVHVSSLFELLTRDDDIYKPVGVISDGVYLHLALATPEFARTLRTMKQPPVTTRLLASCTRLWNGLNRPPATTATVVTPAQLMRTALEVQTSASATSSNSNHEITKLTISSSTQYFTVQTNSSRRSFCIFPFFDGPIFTISPSTDRHRRSLVPMKIVSTFFWH